MDTRPGSRRRRGATCAGGGVVELEHAGYGNPIMTQHTTGSTGRTDGPTGIPEKPGLEGLEATWSSRWEDRGTYTFDRSAPRDRVFSIDTPPPTVSGSLHIGHVFSYTHTDAVARYQRMRGRSVFYPMGWDDNGLPTERRVQNFFGVRCDPSLPFDPASNRRPGRAKEPVAVSRPNFVALCQQPHRGGRAGLRAPVAQARSVGGLVAHLRHRFRTGPAGVPAGLPPSGRAGARWSSAPLPRCGTSISARRCPRPSWRTASDPGAYHRLRFPRARRTTAGSTSRPPGPNCCRPAWPWSPTPTTSGTAPCSAPRCPLRCSGARVPVLAHELADPEKGSGIAMICTFGDTTDVVWWRELSLPTRTVVGPRRPPPPGRVGHGRVGVATTRRAAAAATASWPAAPSSQAQTRIVELLAASGALIGEPQPHHPPGQVLREGRPAARDRLVPTVVRARPFPSATACWPGARSCGGTRPTWPTATGPGWRA